MLLRPNPAGEMLGAALSARQRVLQETSTASSPLQVSCPALAPVLRGFPAKETPQHITGPAPCTLSFDLLSLPWCIRHKPCTCPAGAGRTGTRAGQEGRTSRSLGNVIKAALLGAPPRGGMPWCSEPGWTVFDLNNTYSLHRSQAAPQRVYFFLQLSHAVGNGRTSIFSLPQHILQLSHHHDRAFPLQRARCCRRCLLFAGWRVSSSKSS